MIFHWFFAISVSHDDCPLFYANRTLDQRSGKPRRVRRQHYAAKAGATRGLTAFTSPRRLGSPQAFMTDAAGILTHLCPSVSF